MVGGDGAWSGGVGEGGGGNTEKHYLSPSLSPRLPYRSVGCPKTRQMEVGYPGKRFYMFLGPFRSCSLACLPCVKTLGVTE